MLKILQARIQQYVNHELSDVQTGFQKGRKTRDQIVNIPGSLKKQESFRKTSISAFIDYAKTFACVENSERDGNTRPADLPLEKSVCRSGSNS